MNDDHEAPYVGRREAVGRNGPGKTSAGEDGREESDAENTGSPQGGLTARRQRAAAPDPSDASGSRTIP